MELKIKPSIRNLYPLAGFLVRGASVEGWLREIHEQSCSLVSVAVYPVPSMTANVLWGCLVVPQIRKETQAPGRNTWCQLAGDTLFIPEKSGLYPQLQPAELDALLKGKKHLMHPEFGLVELPEPVEWSTLLSLPPELPMNIRVPAAASFIPARIRTFRIKAAEVDETLSTLEKEHFPDRQQFEEKPLNFWEKLKLHTLRQLFFKSSTQEAQESATGKSALLFRMEAIKSFFSGSSKDWTDKLQLEWEELERRNKKFVDKLMDMLVNDPERALKYAIPLDADGVARGEGTSWLDMQQRWFDFSFWGSDPPAGRGRVILEDDAFSKLKLQYELVARKLIEQQEYRKAAFVYLKLMKDYARAAEVLEEGKLYQEAAAVYLKYAQNKLKAAQCYEKAHSLPEAINLYRELHNYEKVGDLYISMHNRKEAMVFYQLVADGYIQGHQYVKASLVYREKMDNHAISQDLLLRGWRSGKDAPNCLELYFSDFKEPAKLTETLREVYRRDVDMVNRKTFLQVLSKMYKKDPDPDLPIREMAYEIIVAEIPADPSITSELHAFSKDDKQLIKDTLRFKVNKRKRK